MIGSEWKPNPIYFCVFSHLLPDDLDALTDNLAVWKVKYPIISTRSIPIIRDKGIDDDCMITEFLCSKYHLLDVVCVRTPCHARHYQHNLLLLLLGNNFIVRKVYNNKWSEQNCIYMTYLMRRSHDAHIRYMFVHTTPLLLLSNWFPLRERTEGHEK